ncbi:MAG: LPS-assembly protein LptD [Methylophilaceae bacterium]
MLKTRAHTMLLLTLLAHAVNAQAADDDALSAETPQVTESEAPVVLPTEIPAGSIEVEGNKIELQLDKSMRAIGDAVISRGTKKISGDTINYDLQNDLLDVQGNAQIDVGNAKLSGPALQMQLFDNVGEMKNATFSMYQSAKPKASSIIISSEAFSKSLGNLQSQQIGGDSAYAINASAADATLSPTAELRKTTGRGDAKAVLFEGQDKKRLKGARYTTCAAGVDDWYIKSNDLELNDFTESGIAKNAYIEFKGVPILYTPWIGFSFSNQRKSGLLAPSFDTSTKTGFGVTIPYYWNISPNMDATLATRILSKRGVQLQGEFRYLEENFSGIDNLEYLPNDNQTASNRWYANLKHQQNLGHGWSAGFSYERVSDNQYFSDLSTRITTTSRVTLPQQFNVDYADDTWRFNGIAQKFQTLDGISYPYERLPQLTLIGNRDYGYFNANLYTQLVAFDVNKDAPANVTGTRFTIYPSISLPMTNTYGYLTPKIGVHHTSYSLNNDPNNLSSADRTLPIFSLNGGLYFDRDFKIANRAYSQTLEPRMFYVYIPSTKQSNLPVFDSSLSDLNFSSLFSENQYTGNDRINDANQLSLALTTRFIESATGVQRLSASIGQRYYFTNQTVDLPGETLRQSNSSDIIAGLSTNLKTHWNLDAFWQYNTDNSNAVRTTISSRFNPEPGKTLNLSYSYRKDVSGAAINTGINQIDLSAQWPLGKGWYGVGRTNYSFYDKQNIETMLGLEYNAGCWIFRTVLQRVTTATADTNTAFMFQLELGGLASIGNNPLAVIKRSVPGYVSTGLIPDTRQQSYYE